MYGWCDQLENILITQRSKKNEEKNSSIVVSSVIMLPEKIWDIIMTIIKIITTSTTTTTIIISLIFSAGVIRLLFIRKTECLQWIVINRLSSNFTMWDLSLCSRILQDHEFSGEQNDELCSFYSRTYLSQNQMVFLLRIPKGKVHLISYGTCCETERQKSF